MRAVGQRGVGHHPAPQRAGAEPGRVAQRALPRRVRDLVGQVEQLLHPPHEVAGRQLGPVQHVIELVALGPSPRGPAEAEVGLAELVQVMVALQRLELRPQPDDAAEHVPDRTAGHRRGGGVVGTAGLEDQCGQDGRKPGGVEPVPQTGAQRLRDHEVHLVVDAHQHPAAFGDPALPRASGRVLLEVAQGGQHVADPVELAGDRVRALLDPASQRAGVPVELEPALGPAGMVLTVGAAVAGMLPQLTAQPGDLVVRVRRLLAPATRGRRGRQAVGAVPQCAGQVAAGLGVAPVEVARYPHPGHR